MKNWMSQMLIVACIIGGTALYGCSDDEKGASGSPDAVADAITEPTGKMENAEGAQGVAEAFGKLQMGGSSTRPQRQQGMDCSDMTPGSTEYSCTCDDGGSLNVSASGNENSGNADWSYDNCCMFDCCYDGGGWISVVGDGTGEFSMCASMEIKMECTEMNVDGTLNLEYCMDSSGQTWYLVEYDGATFAVTGYFNSDTGGQWTVRDANGEWECTQDSEGAGSCTNGSETIDWE